MSWALMTREAARSPADKKMEGRRGSGVHSGLQEQAACSSVDLRACWPLFP